MKKPIHQLFIICLLLLIISEFLQANVRLPVLVSDGMVLQRDTKLIIWGWAAPGEKVQVRFNKKSVSTITGYNGRWKIDLPPMKAGGFYTMDVKRIK